MRSDREETSGPRRAAKGGALLVALALVAAACGGGDDDAAVDAAAGADEQAQSTDDDAMEDDAMEDDEDAMADDEDAMEDDAMEDDAMEDDEDAMEEEAMEDDAMADGGLSIEFSGLEPLGDELNYEAWVVVDGAPVTAGIFDIDDTGAAVHVDGSPAAFHGDPEATAVVISIEPEVDDDPAPAATKILGGDVAEDGSFELTIDHPAALGTDFADYEPTFILGTPTTTETDDENSGIWFLSLPGPEAISLPELPEGWLYEGWIVVDGQPISTGRFADPDGVDDFDGYSGPEPGPAYPGEDLIVNAPDGLTFPLDLSGATAVISVEPDPDDSPAPFALKPFVGEVPADATDHVNYTLGAGPLEVSGSGSIEG